MNKFIYKVIKWLEDPESVSQEERDKNKEEADAVCFVAQAASYHATYFAADNNPVKAASWLNEHLQVTGENKQDYLDAIEEEKVLTDTNKELEGAITPVDWNHAPDWADRLMRSDTGNYFWCNIEKYLYLSWPIGEVPLVFGAVGSAYTIGDLELIEGRQVRNSNNRMMEKLEEKVVTDTNKELSERVKVIGREHYTELENNKSKYHREIKKGVFVDVYDVLSAFEVVNPAMQHALKKMLAQGKRGAKDTVKDMQEAIQSIERAIELEALK